MTEQQETIWLTQEAFDKLEAELENLKGPVRQEVIDRISAAREEGDLKENGGYHAAREEQGKVEGRIRQLEDMLRRAEVGETPPNDGIVEPGMVVTYKFVGDDETEKFLLGAARSSPRASRSTRRSRRSAPPSSAPRRATRSPTPRPTARTCRSRSSTRSPTRADPPPRGRGYPITR